MIKKVMPVRLVSLKRLQLLQILVPKSDLSTRILIGNDKTLEDIKGNFVIYVVFLE